MALCPGTRISLKFNDINNYECWFLVDHHKTVSVSQLQQQINNRFYNNIKGKITLTLKGSLIPPWESTLIFRDNDEIVVKKENDNAEAKCCPNKKKMKKMKSDPVIEIDKEVECGGVWGQYKRQWAAKYKAKKIKHLDIKEIKEEEKDCFEVEIIEERCEKKGKKRKECLEEKEEEKTHFKRKKGMEQKKEYPVKNRKKEIELCDDSPVVFVGVTRTGRELGLCEERSPVVGTSKKKKKDIELCEEELPVVVVGITKKKEIELCEEELPTVVGTTKKKKKEIGLCDEDSPVVFVGVTQTGREIGLYEEDTPVVVGTKKKKKKKEIVLCDEDSPVVFVEVTQTEKEIGLCEEDTPVVVGTTKRKKIKLDIEKYSTELVEKEQKKQRKKHRKIKKCSKNESSSCDQVKEIVVVNDDDDGEKDNCHNQSSNCDLNKEIIIEEEEEEEEEENGDVEISSVEILPVVFPCEIQDSSETLETGQECEEPSVKSSQIDRISLPTVSPISITNKVKNFDSFTNSGTQENSAEVTNIFPVKETVEVFGISKESLSSICKAIKAGESLTITENEVKKVELCPNTNENILNIVNNNNGVEHKKLPVNNRVPAKNGNKTHRTRRHRKRRHGPSFACAPFLSSMSSVSESDSSVIVSTPKAQYVGSFLSSDKHIHFDSEEEDEVSSNITPANGPSELNQSTVKPFNSLNIEKCQTQLENLENSMRSEISKQGETVGNCSVLKKGCAVYKRGVGFIKPLNTPPSPIKTSQQNNQLTNKNQTQFNSSILKPNYEVFPVLSGLSCVTGDRIAFKRLEMDLDYCPVISDYREATVVTYEDQTKTITLKFHNSQETKRTLGKFELNFEDEEEGKSEDETDEEIETVDFNTLMDVKLLPKS